MILVKHFCFLSTRVKCFRLLGVNKTFRFFFVDLDVAKTYRITRRVLVLLLNFNALQLNTEKKMAQLFLFLFYLFYKLNTCINASIIA